MEKVAIIIILFIIISGLLQHIIHELLHIIVGKLLGLELLSVKWFTYHGGTKVTFKDEDIILSNRDDKIPKQWIIMNLAGIVGTTVLAYIFVLVYWVLPMGYLKLLFWVLSAMFLITDSGYSVISSFGNNGGDLYLVKRFFNNSIYIKLISITTLIVNLMIFISLR